MTKQVDKNVEHMMKTWGTEFLASEYGWEKKIENRKMLREVINDEGIPKTHNFSTQNELHAKIRNDDDYDDWNYGTEPLYEMTK